MSTTAPDLATVLSSWTWAPLTDLAVLLGTLGYAWLVRRLHTAGHRNEPHHATGHQSEPHHRWPAGRAVSWGLAMLALVLAGNSAVAVYSDVLFWVHMAQHLLLIMIAPILLVWAQPVRLVQTALPTVGVRLERLLARRPVRWATAPLTGLALYAALVVLTHLTGFQQVSATHGGVRAVELAAYLVCGWLFFFPLLGGELGSWSLPYLLRFLVLALGMGADTLTGVALMLTSRPLAPAYAAAHPGWGPTALLDQEAAGAIMWFGGDLLMMILMIVVAVQWGRAGPDQQGLGQWLEGARRRSLLGAPAADFPTTGPRGPAGTSTDSTTHDDPEIDIDEDQRALDAYNAALAALHAQSPARRPGPAGDR